MSTVARDPQPPGTFSPPPSSPDGAPAGSPRASRSRSAALLLLIAPLGAACLPDEDPTHLPGPGPTATATAPVPAPARAQTATATAARSAAPLLSTQERTDGCVYALAELRGVSNPALARSAAGNRARAAMKTRLQALQDALPAELQDSFQQWRDQARVEIPALQALGRRHWQATARVQLEGLPAALRAALLNTASAPVGSP